MTRIFLDASTLIALGTVGELDLLKHFSGDLVVLSAIRDEVTTEPARTNLARFVETDTVGVADPTISDHFTQAKDVLDEPTANGDVHLVAAVLAYTADDRPIGIVSDDRRVRTVVDGLGATVTGTIGVIVRAVDEGLSPTDAKALVDRVDAHGLHMTASLRRKADALIDDAADSFTSK